MDTESKIRRLERDLAFAKDEAEIAKSELKEQKKLLEAIEGDSEKTNKYLHNEISRVRLEHLDFKDPSFLFLTVFKRMSSILFYRFVLENDLIFPILDHNAKSQSPV